MEHASERATLPTLSLRSFPADTRIRLVLFATCTVYTTSTTRGATPCYTTAECLCMKRRRSRVGSVGEPFVVAYNDFVAWE